jgi:hypothetical protein
LQEQQQMITSAWHYSSPTSRWAGGQLDSKLAGKAANDHRASALLQPHQQVGSWTASLQEQQQIITRHQPCCSPSRWAAGQQVFISLTSAPPASGQLPNKLAGSAAVGQLANKLAGTAADDHMASALLQPHPQVGS